MRTYLDTVLTTGSTNHKVSASYAIIEINVGLTDSWYASFIMCTMFHAEA